MYAYIELEQIHYTPGWIYTPIYRSKINNGLKGVGGLPIGVTGYSNLMFEAVGSLSFDTISPIFIIKDLAIANVV